MAIRKALMVGVALTGLSAAAQAADYMPIYGGGPLIAAPELKPVEIGTGWYLRGDVSYDFDQSYDGRLGVDTPFASASVPYRELTLDEGFSGGIGIGYQFTDLLRADVTARYGKADAGGFVDLSPGCIASASCYISERGDARTWDLMANAYVDLGTFAGFTPYVGGGLGAVNVSYEDRTLEYCDASLVAPGSAGCESLGVDGEDSWRFAYALTAGVAYNVNRNIALDVGYRYLNVDGGAVYDLPLDSIGLPGSAIMSDDNGFDRHTITAGLRYKLW